MDGMAEARTLGGNPDELKKPGREGSPAFSADPGLLRGGIDRPKLCPSCVIIGVQSASATTLPGAWEA